ncbi:MAG: hypothetical protein K6L80_12100 [Agarilytica sp.]
MKYIFLALILVSPLSYSANESTPRDRTIKELLFYENDVVVKISPAYENSQDCSSNATDRLQLGYSSETGQNEALVSALLAAAAASKKVGFGVGGCKGQYPEIYRVDLVF